MDVNSLINPLPISHLAGEGESLAVMSASKFLCVHYTSLPLPPRFYCSCDPDYNHDMGGHYWRGRYARNRTRHQCARIFKAVNGYLHETKRIYCWEDQHTRMCKEGDLQSQGEAGV